MPEVEEGLDHEFEGKGSGGVLILNKLYRIVLSGRSNHDLRNSSEGGLNMRLEAKPLAVHYGYRAKGNLTCFVSREGTLQLRGASRIIQQTLSLCNGLRTVAELHQLLAPTSTDKVDQVLETLSRHGVVEDSRELYRSFHKDSGNPSEFVYSKSVLEIELLGRKRPSKRRGLEETVVHSPLVEAKKGSISWLVAQRESVRHFSEATIDSTVVLGLLQVAYSAGDNGHWTVPSGGGLYPLDLYLIVLNDRQFVPKGVYYWAPKERTLSRVRADAIESWIYKAFNAEALLEGAACVLCVAADIDRSASKYANLGYRLTLLEAGHVAQNAALFCVEQGLGSVEYCGFNDKILAKSLGLRYPQESVMTTLVIGQTKGVSDHTDDKRLSDATIELERALVGEDKPIHSISVWEPRVRGYVMPKWAAMSRYSSPATFGGWRGSSRKVGFATGRTLNEATLKALAEGYERYALEQYRYDIRAKARDLGEPYLDPRKMGIGIPDGTSVSDAVEPFDPNEEVNWISATRWNTGEKVWVPSDLVFYVGQGRRSVLYRASSNGVAAHFDVRAAVDNALLELIERDAFNVLWYAKRQAPRLDEGLLSRGLQGRIARWRDRGYSVNLLDLTVDGPPVVLVVIWSRERVPALASGASARPMVMDAAERAFDEAEFMAVSWNRKKPRHGMQFADIKTPEDHGLFFIDPANLQHAEWLLEGDSNACLPLEDQRDPYSFDPLVVDITPPVSDCRLKVVRVLSEELMPISFGYGEELRGHPRLRMLGYEWSAECPSVPHFFA